MSFLDMWSSCTAPRHREIPGVRAGFSEAVLLWIALPSRLGIWVNWCCFESDLLCIGPSFVHWLAVFFHFHIFLKYTLKLRNIPHIHSKCTTHSHQILLSHSDQPGLENIQKDYNRTSIWESEWEHLDMESTCFKYGPQPSTFASWPGQTVQDGVLEEVRFPKEVVEEAQQARLACRWSLQTWYQSKHYIFHAHLRISLNTLRFTILEYIRHIIYFDNFPLPMVFLCRQYPRSVWFCSGTEFDDTLGHKWCGNQYAFDV